jgi:hypothetical protein
MDNKPGINGENMPANEKSAQIIIKNTKMGNKKSGTKNGCSQI